jgi:hypothetical protein
VLAEKFTTQNQVTTSEWVGCEVDTVLDGGGVGGGVERDTHEGILVNVHLGGVEGLHRKVGVIPGVGRRQLA